MSKQLKYWKVSKYLDFITFLTLLLWVVLRQASFIVFPVSVTIFYKGIMPSEKVLDFPVDCNTLTGSVNL